MQPPRAKSKPKDEAVKFASLGQDKDGFEVKCINSVKGEVLGYLLRIFGTVISLTIAVDQC